MSATNPKTKYHFIIPTQNTNLQCPQNIWKPNNTIEYTLKVRIYHASPPIVVVSSSLLIPFWCKMLLWLSRFLPWLFLIHFLFKFDKNAPLAASPPPVVASSSYPLLLQIWSKMLLLLLPRLLLWSFLTQFLFKSDAKFTSGCLARPLLWSFLINFLFKFLPKCSWLWGRFCFTSYANLIPNGPQAALCLHLWPFLNFSSNLVQNASLPAPPPSVVVSYSFWFKSDAKCTSGCLVPSCGRFLLTSN